ncbi:hypothetical protein FOC1_g10008394 [Fusarium oxysporum f. sp. cubense race 1]|uniref:Uncharacterized protein n=1 Tax=Fusarium oxysporum f. sp. cubense (strain race 1) TaxID=1229664 RepID=N4U572_FUSC1|nr:hypothetical protein FOC1_g10008394 [Fusarium oxysporum f. sp. cubense race 1]
MTRRNESEIIDDLRQTESATKRKLTIRQFTKALRREDRFQQAWDAAGGASGLARLMAEFSIRDVRDMCKRLGSTASAQKAQSQRRAALGELVTILYEGREDDRSLTSFYQDIVPACNLELVKKFEKDRKIEWTPPQTKRLFLGHREQHEDKFLSEILCKDKNIRFYQHRRLFRGNIAFCEKILTALLAKEGKIHVPSDLIDEVAMPVLKRLLKSRYDDERRIKYLSLVLQCTQKHEEEISQQLVLRQGGLLQYTVDRWAKAADGSESKRQYQARLVQAIQLLPKEKSPIELEIIRQTLWVPWELDIDGRYDFFRLFIQHHKDYKIDIESDSEQDLARLKDLPERAWPSDLFFTINYKKSLQLFEKLESLFPKNNFLQVANQSGTILNQSQGHIKHSGFGDVEIVRALLIRKSNTQDEHQGWLDHAIGLINERKTNAQQAREAVERAYWARAALNLCVAIGDLQTLNDTIIWSRRFIKDSLTSHGLFSVKVFKTKEIEEVLGAMPDERVSSPEAVVSFTSALRKKYIEFANQVLINIVETATLAVGEPGFKAHNWTWLFNLIMAVTGQRMNRLEIFFKSLAECSEAGRERCQRNMMEIVWKPTTDLLIEAGAVVRNPALATAHGGSLFDSLTTSSNRESVKGSYVYRLLSRTSLSPPLLAELARFLIDRMRERLGSEAIRAQMQDIVFVIERLASSDQPSLACPFIRDLVLDSEGAKESSSWHRHLLSVGFLSVLPAKPAKEMLYTMASAIKEKMREQNQNKDAKEQAERSEKTTEEDVSTGPKPSQGPSIKVTTVKMLAQILQYNLFMDPSSSCEILVGLLAEARHIDIRITITNSLFAILEEPTCPLSLRKHILEALGEYIVPAAAQLNERRGLTEADWVAASAQDAPLPEIGAETPLLKLLILKVKGQSLNEEDKRRLASLVMGAVEQSAVNNTRWMKLFLSKNNFSPEEEIPHLPVHLTTVSALYGQLQPYTPVSVFNMVRSAALINVDPSPGILRITKAIQEDRDLVNSKAGKHWLSQFSNPGRDSFKFGIMLSAAMVQQSPADRESKLAVNGVSLPMLQSFVIEYIERLLKIGQADMVMTLVMRLSGRRLPSVFRIKLRTIPVPLSDGTAEEDQAFTEELYKLIGDLGSRQYHPYHMDFQKLKEEFDYWPLTQSFGRFALMLAEFQEYDLASTEQPTLKDYLCWEIIGHILTKAKDPKDANIVEDVRQLMRKWETCEDEAMRTMGMKFKGLLKDADKTWYKRV